MAVYKNFSDKSAVASVEFTPVSDGNFSFIHVRDGQDIEAVKQWITSQDVGQSIVAQTKLGKETVLVTHGEKTKEQMLDVLKGHGDDMQLAAPEKKFDAWKWRGILSMTGHPMQLASSFMLVDAFDPKKHAKVPAHKIVTVDGKKYARKPFDTAKGVFAVSNLAANLINITYGAQRSSDDHRMADVKNKLNDELGESIVNYGELFPPTEKRAELRKEPAAPKSTGDKLNDFMKANSVTLGEVGLRYFGGVSLVFPMKWENWKGGLKEYAKGNFKAGFQKMRNPDKFIFNAGTFWLAGKTLAFFAKTPDPFNPDRTWLDKFREDYLFKISTVTEAIGSTTMAYDAYAKRKITYGGKVSTDYLGSVGGMLFTTAFIMRLNAPYGVKDLNMEEVYAHATDTLAKTPPDKLPQLMADTAGYLTEHLKDKDVQFGEVYNKLMGDLYRYHHIALDNLGARPEERIAAHKCAPNSGHKHDHVSTLAENGTTIGAAAIQRRPTVAELAAKAPAAGFAERTTQNDSKAVGHSLGA
ncbi:MAG: hypothetical protein EBV03_02145 [Proteobacteria bacterium]|nr:hypothetical protein [Pseudomonadota bacterium]